MRAVNNDVKIAIGFCNNTEEMKNWSKVYLTNVSEDYDVISLHYYYGGDLTGLNTFSAEQKLREMKGVTENYNEAVKGLLSFLDDNGLSALKNKEICVDEWNWQFGENGTTSMFVGNSCFLISLINSINISNLSSSSFFHPLEGQIEVNNETQEITGVGYAIRLLENHKNTKLVNVDVSEDLKALVSVNDNEVIISISNPYLTSKYVVLNNLITLGNFTEGNVKIISADSISNTDICTVSAGNMVMETYETSDFDGFLVPGISLVQIILR